MTAVNRASAGMLVLGMHRSGTSAIARILQIGGADIGARVLGSSAGNELGHWEDALAVELHERLLAGLGSRWDETFTLPADWPTRETAVYVQRAISDYLGSNRSAQRLWVAKDPRLALFARLWREAAAALGMPLGSVLMLRHPVEVANSLATRDGIAHGRGLLLWLEYMLAAVSEAEKMPCAVIRFDQLLADWRGCIERIRKLPGGDLLSYDDTAVADVERFLDHDLRHHHVPADAQMPRIIADAWEMLSGMAQEGVLTPGAAAEFSREIATVRELLLPVLDETRVTNRLLWARVNRAEGPLVEMASTTASLPSALEEVGARVDRQHQEISEAAAAHAELLRGATAGIDAARSAAEGSSLLVQQLGPQVAAAMPLLASLGTSIDALAPALADIRAEVSPLSGRISSDIGALAANLADQQQVVRSAISVDIALLRDALRSELQAAAEDGRTLAADEAARTASLEARLAELASLLPRHEEIVAALARSELTLQHTHAELVDTDNLLQQSMHDLHEETVLLQDAHAHLERQRAELDDAHRQLSALRAERDRLHEQSQELDRIKHSRSWRITRPMRVIVRLLTHGWGSADVSKMRAIARGLIARTPFLTHSLQSKLITKTLAADGGRPADLPDAGMAPLLKLAAQQSDLPDLFVWSVIDWHFRTQRPQHLARALSQKGHRVFYISVNFIDSATPGFHLEPLDSTGSLYQVHLHLEGEPLIYSSMPTTEQVETMKRSLGELLGWTRTLHGVSLIQHPYWSVLARSVPSTRVVYDCMDHHGGFENNSSEVLEAEHRLVTDSELVIVTSAWLQTEFAGTAREIALIRNAGEFDFFSKPPQEVFQDVLGRKIIGYFGAIAEWFDQSLIREVATANPEALVVLVGHDSVGAGAYLSDLPNVRMVGEVAYARLPYWLHAFDVCLLPFQVIPLTVATNPVKVYEYLAAGKPVVTVDLPEMAQFGNLVTVADNAQQFSDAVARILAMPRDMAMHRRRKSFAAEQTWLHRAQALDEKLRFLSEPRISVVVLTYNNLDFTKACLLSIESFSDYANLEVIVVDNASSDGSAEFLTTWVAESSSAGHERRLIINKANLGFSAGNNVGLAAATGEFLVMLNNDTYVTPGWVRTLCNHFRADESLGLLGPVTNNIGNEARIEIDYANMDEMFVNAGEYTRRHPGKTIPINTVAFFCVALPRKVYEKVGGLDEAFGQGFFEDDDYCRRVQAEGWTVACAEDVFVHHHLSASFNLVKSEVRAELFRTNKAIYEKKWGTWQPHVYRDINPPAAKTG